MVPAERLPSSYEWEVYEEHSQPRKPRQRRRRRRSRLPATVKLCLLGVAVVVLGVMYLSQQLDTVYLSLELAELEQQVDLAKQRNGHLRVQLEQVRSLPVIEEIARTKLGMVDPTDTSILVAAGMPKVLPNDAAYVGVSKPMEPEVSPWTVLAGWLNKLFPVGGVEAGEL